MHGMYTSFAPFALSILPSPQQLGLTASSPARFYVAAALKMIFAHLLLDFEFKLADPNAQPFFTLGKTRLPNPFQSILVRRRAVGRGQVVLT
jgi:hypothetical protein